MHRFNMECKRIIEEMAANINRSWGCGQRACRQVAIISDPKYDALMAEVKLLMKQQEDAIHALLQANVVQRKVMDLNQPKDFNYAQQRNYNGGYRNGYPGGNLPYHPNNWNDPNFFWGNLNNALQPIGYNVPTQAPPQNSNAQSDVSMSDMMQQLVNQQQFIG